MNSFSETMQLPKETYLYSKVSTGLDYDRQLLVKEQKACRTRDHQYTLDTKRRLKEIEERKRKQELKEQQLKEIILQQRKQRLQEERNRFQRVQSSSRRPASTVKVPTLNKAVSNIQGAQTMNTHQPFGRCRFTPKPPGGSSSPHSLQVGSEGQAYTRYMQVRNLANWEEVTSQLLKEQAQEPRDTQDSSSESLFSQDSLENEDGQSNVTGQSQISNIQDAMPTSADHIGLKSSNVPFLKGILKMFNTNKLRDSLELIGCKAKMVSERTKGIKKKVRWLDEMESNGDGNQEIVAKRLSKEAETRRTLVQPPDATRRAWPDVDPQQEPTGKSRMERSAPTGLGVSPQAHSLRTESATVLPKARRGRILRPLSSSQVVSIQGEVLVPTPPPRSEVTGENSMYNAKTCNNVEGSQGKTGLAIEQAIYPAQSEGHPQETLSKGIDRLPQSDGKVRSDSRKFQKEILERTPTDEEIEQLWDRLRDALASKAGGSKSQKTHDRPVSALRQPQTNLSRGSVNGGRPFTRGKAARTSGFLLSSSNAQSARSPMRRPSMEKNMLKNRSATLDYRNPPVLYQAPVPSRTDRMVHNQGPAVDSVQVERATKALQSPYGLSAVSLEELKVLQSLNRLNHRLKDLADVAAGKIAPKGITRFA